MKRHLPSWPKKADAGLIALMEEPTISAAAKKAGVSERTLGRWAKRPDFEAKLKEIRAKAIRQAVNRVTRAAGSAVSTLLELARHGESEAVRLRAAIAILDHAWRGQELLDISERLVALEAFREQEVGPWPA
mgnify:CR=1 FL=1